MCHTTDSRPPAAPGAGTVAGHGPIEITTGDGDCLAAYWSVPATPNGRNVVLLPDVRGLHPFYEALARRFAEAGFHVLALDYYGRSAGVARRDDSFDWQPHLAALEPAHVEADVAAAADLLRAAHPGPVFTVGFCMGGAHSWRLASRDLGLAGAIGFYGPPRFFGDATEGLAAPLLMLLAGEDEATPREDFLALAAGFDRAGKEYEMHIYEGAPHSFFDRSFGQWEEACADAWRRILDFTERHSGPGLPDAAGTEDRPDLRESERYLRGAARMAELDGGSGTRQAAYDGLSGVAPDLPRLAVEFAYGDIHSRPGLAAASRELVTLGVLVALGGCEPQLRTHAGAALNAGLSPVEVSEAIMQAVPYAGFPRVFSAMAAVREVLTERTGA
ncbi:dienelactone hydrolase family protein [Sphaerisporangium fuscum]|uniref:dienelactone hydrolase family protein n=1 Tax=Sphaerisporangium fuscum TaxID=2835868 RepID=UPI001BDC2D76|nr:dienelactone hydrolase family protein [Sphaerisporangium fuscum]